MQTCKPFILHSSSSSYLYLFFCFVKTLAVCLCFLFSESILLFGCFCFVLFQEATRFEPEEWEPGEFGTTHQASQLEPVPFHQVVIRFKLN